MKIRILILTTILIVSSSFMQVTTKKISVIFIGDSITESSKVSLTETSPYSAYQFLKTAKPDIIDTFSNQGHGGATTLDFLPGSRYMNSVQNIASQLEARNARLLFSIMLGTNDSAIEGTNGAPVSSDTYIRNLITIVQYLQAHYPDCQVVIHMPLWYSANTYNSAKYLQEGLDRISVYRKELLKLKKENNVLFTGNVHLGDQKGYAYFKKHYLEDMFPQQGHQGIFYLHPNAQGASYLGRLWGKAMVTDLK